MLDACKPATGRRMRFRAAARPCTSFRRSDLQLANFVEELAPFFNHVERREGLATHLEPLLIIVRVALDLALHEHALEGVLAEVAVKGDGVVLLEWPKLVGGLAVQQLDRGIIEEGDVSCPGHVVALSGKDPAPCALHRLVALFAVTVEVVL
eukprot:scaffold10995_cov112-Isochrysis_galbana.AAC.3